MSSGIRPPFFRSSQDAADPAEKGRLKQLFLDHETVMLTALLDWFLQLSDIRIIGPEDPAFRTLPVSIVAKNKSNDEIFTFLADRKPMIVQEHFYGSAP